MKQEPLQIRLISGPDSFTSYKLCNTIVHANKKIDALSAFEFNHEQSPVSVGSLDKSWFDFAPRPLFKGRSWLAGKQRQLACSRIDRGFVIEVPGVADFFIGSDRPVLLQATDRDARVDKAVFEQLLLGPPLMLVLAVNRLFALHASAVTLNDKAVLFMGESGSGKSTLARWLNNRTPFVRLTDDISVLERRGGNFQLLPDFPQLKLTADEQHSNSPAAPSGALVLINRKPDSPVKLKRLGAMRSIQALLNHSVAAQLFDRPLARQHLSFMSELSRNMPVCRLDYPDGQQCLDAVAEILAKQIH